MALPSAIALATIADDSFIVADDHRNNYASIQTTVNALITYLSTLPTAGAITGRINSNGTIESGSGFTCVHTSTGIYTITWSAPFAAGPDIVAVGTLQRVPVSVDGGTNGTLPGTSTFRFCSVDETGALTDQAFMFTAATVA